MSAPLEDASLFGIVARGVGEQTSRILERLDGSPANAEERRRIIEAVLREGRDHGGKVDPNRVRARLSPGVRPPQLVGAVIYGLRRAGVLERRGYVSSDDLGGGNAGKPAPLYVVASDYMPARRHPGPRTP